jgi:excisionase family DNA binding protein
MKTEKLYNITEASNILGYHIDTLRMWDRQGKIKSVRVGNGWRRFPQSEIDRILGGGYIRPKCPRCDSERLSEVLAAGNGLECLDCGKTFFLTEGETRKDVPVEA